MTGLEIWVIIENESGTVKPVSYEVLHAAKTLGWGKVIAVYPCAEPKIDSLLRCGADQVIVLQNNNLVHYNYSAYLKVSILLAVCHKGRHDTFVSLDDFPIPCNNK